MYVKFKSEDMNAEEFYSSRMSKDTEKVSKSITIEFMENYAEYKAQYIANKPELENKIITGKIEMGIYYYDDLDLLNEFIEENNIEIISLHYLRQNFSDVHVLYFRRIKTK